MNENLNEPATDESAATKGSRSRAVAGHVVFLIFLMIAVVFLADRLRTILKLYQLGLRHDAILLQMVCEVSRAIVIGSFGYLLASLIHYRGKSRPLIAAIVLILAMCSAGSTADADRKLRLRARDNLHQLQRALESYHLPEGSADVPISAPPDAN